MELRVLRQCFDTVGWVAGRATDLQIVSHQQSSESEVLPWEIYVSGRFVWDKQKLNKAKSDIHKVPLSSF